MESSRVRRALAEAIGTFVLVFTGTGAIVVDHATGGAITHLGVSMAFGLAVMTMIYAVGDVSGAHLNPAVTVGFWAARRLPSGDVGPYVIGQCGGALVASALLLGMFPQTPTLGVTAPDGALAPSLVTEVVLTFLLMFVILGVATGAREKGVMAGAAVGATVGLAALVGGPISGASLNPARSLGPALVSGQLSWLWLYIVAPVVGAQLAVLGCRCVREPGCCSTPLEQT